MTEDSIHIVQCLWSYHDKLEARARMLEMLRVSVTDTTESSADALRENAKCLKDALEKHYGPRFDD